MLVLYSLLCMGIMSILCLLRWFRRHHHPIEWRATLKVQKAWEQVKAKDAAIADYTARIEAIRDKLNRRLPQ
jgi:hypothetical protein